MEKDLNKLSDMAYKCAKEHGFHEEEKSDEHFLMLVITELSEAIEADRKDIHAKINIFIDWQTRFRPFAKEDYDKCFISDFECYIKDSFEDEISDIAIRILDLAGLRNIEIVIDDVYLIDCKLFTEFSYSLCSYLFIRNKSVKIKLNAVFNIINTFCNDNNIDLFQHIEWKMKYNELRPKLHGKKY